MLNDPPVMVVPLVTLKPVPVISVWPVFISLTDAPDTNPCPEIEVILTVLLFTPVEGVIE